MNLPSDVHKLLSKLKRRGFEAFAVGGCVRDSLLRKPPKDWDIATSALPEDVKRLFPRTFDTGIRHGTVTVVLHRVPYEVTTYRVDGEYLDGRRPSSVAFAARIEDDLGRRDFTMNAVAYNPDRGFVDPYGGQGDIARGVIRCVGEAALRFDEDALRMLRAVRFAAQLGFEIEAPTFDAIRRRCAHLALVSAERVSAELIRIVAAPFPQKIALLETSGLMPYVLRGRAYGGDVNAAVAAFGDFEPTLRLALFLSWAGDDTAALLRDLRFDNKTVRAVSTLVRLLPAPVPRDRYGIKVLMADISPALTESLFRLKRDEAALGVLRDIVASGECYNLGGLAVKGCHLIKLGLRPGADIGDALARMLDAVRRDPALNTYAGLIRIIPVPRS